MPAEPADTAVSCRGLRKVYDARRRWSAGGAGAPVVAVDGLDLEIRRGECFGLLGPNGAGKTTTVEILEGAPRADRRRGRAARHVLGARRGPRCASASASRCRRRSCPSGCRSRRSLHLFRSFYARARPVDGGARRRRADGEARRLGGQALRRPAAAAGGRLRAGRRARLLFLDEPTTGLDPQSRRQLWDLVLRFRGAGGTVVLTTHYMEEAERLCDRVAIIDHGSIIALGIAGGADRRRSARARDRVRARRGGAALAERRAARAARRDGRAPVGRTAVRAHASPSRPARCRRCSPRCRARRRLARL